MTALTVRGLSDETRRALKLRAHRNGRSMEAEVRRIIAAAVQPLDEPGNLGDVLHAISQRNGVTDEDHDALVQALGEVDGPIEEPVVFEERSGT